MIRLLIIVAIIFTIWDLGYLPNAIEIPPPLNLIPLQINYQSSRGPASRASTSQPGNRLIKKSGLQVIVNLIT